MLPQPNLNTIGETLYTLHRKMVYHIKAWLLHWFPVIFPIIPLLSLFLSWCFYKMGIKALVSAFSSVLLSTQSCYVLIGSLRHFRDFEIYFDTSGIETLDVLLLQVLLNINPYFRLSFLPQIGNHLIFLFKYYTPQMNWAGYIAFS